MGKPFFSVIIPAHNSAGFIRRGLDSVRDQSFTDYELIVICDRCTDSTAQIALEYTDKVITVDFGRSGLSRNAGIDAAAGEWILFLDDDDWFLHEFAFEMLVDALTHIEDLDILEFSFIWKGKGYARNSPKQHWPAVWARAWRREFIGAERFTSLSRSEDYLFAKTLIPKARLAYFDQPLYYYNFMRPGSVSDRIGKGTYDSPDLPESVREDAERYERKMRSEVIP